ncbi:hypothetical protein SLEP1_g18725 [Rubroshorea leprosula]|uniref:Uncharacterized protein n=1 Tax=Rubroshorea leprosula TaxID=152421 RepID=A0AAV5IYH9_9ROSI|nr:hypothetical protein SLEP1_g18725 [Rubroshorea leprosula]
MSLEETLSIGSGEGEQELSSTSGSEVESSRNGVESSRSGGNEGVGGEMEEVGVPSNVLKADHSKAKYYNEEEEVVSEVVRYEGLWRSRSDIGHLVEHYSIPGHVLLSPTGEMERACSASKDHWMLVYRHYLTGGLRFLVPKLLVALLVEYRLRMTQLIPNDEVERLERRGGEVMDIMYLTSPAMLEAIKIYRLSSMSGAYVWREDLTLLEKRSKASVAPSVRERVVGGTLRSRPSRGAQAEVAPNSKQGRKKAEEVATHKRRRVEEVQQPQPDALIKKRKKSLIPRQKLSFYESTSKTVAKRFIRSTFPEVDLQRARHEVEEHGGSSVIRHALETVNVINALAVKYYDCLKEMNNLVEKNEELNQQKQSAEQNFNDLTSELKKVRAELASAQVATEVEVEKRRKTKEELAKAREEFAEVDCGPLPHAYTCDGVQRLPEKGEGSNPKVDMTKSPSDLKRLGGEGWGKQNSRVLPNVTFNWEQDEAGQTVLPPRLEYEFIAVTKIRLRLLQIPRSERMLLSKRWINSIW